MPMHIVLFDNAEWRVGLYPLTLTRPAADLRVGILTIAEKRGEWLRTPYSFLSSGYLREKYPLLADRDVEVWAIRGNCCPDERLCDAIQALKPGQALVDRHSVIAVRTNAASLSTIETIATDGYEKVSYDYETVKIIY